MSFIYPEVTIEWAGVEYSTKATFKVINKIEQTVSLAGLVTKVQQGDVPLSHLATVYGNLLRGANVNVSDEEVFASMFDANASSELSQQDVIALAAGALSACFPTNAPIEKVTKKKKSR
jgi:type II secretory pathway component PulK